MLFGLTLGHLAPRATNEQVCFCLWAVSLDEGARQTMVACGVVKALCMNRAHVKEKVLRMAVAALMVRITAPP